MPLTTLTSFETITAQRTHDLSDTTGRATDLNAAVSERSSTVTIDYDPTGEIYTLVGDAVATFTPADRLPGGGYIDHYRTASDELRLYNNVRSGASQAGAPVQLSYLSFGVWTHSTTNGARDTYLLFGYPTGSADMPRSGTASYQTMVTGSRLEVGDLGSSEITGSANFSANFGAGTVDTQLTLNTMAGGEIGTYSGTGSIAVDQFSGNFASSTRYFDQGTFTGGFFGPAASEMGYQFFIRHYNPDPYAGASINRVDDWMVGTVVGVKE